MAMNIKNAEVERLAAEAANLVHESKTEAIRQALVDRVRKLKRRSARSTRQDRVDALLAQFRREFPQGDCGRKMTKTEKEEILGYGPGAFDDS